MCSPVQTLLRRSDGEEAETDENKVDQIKPEFPTLSTLKFESAYFEDPRPSRFDLRRLFDVD